MSTAEFKAHARAISTEEWGKFTRLHSIEFKIFGAGILAWGLINLSDKFRHPIIHNSIVAILCIIGLLLGFFAFLSLLLSTLSHACYIAAWQQYLRRQYKLILIAATYELYLVQAGKKNTQ